MLADWKQIFQSWFAIGSMRYVKLAFVFCIAVFPALVGIFPGGSGLKARFFRVQPGISRRFWFKSLVFPVSVFPGSTGNFPGLLVKKSRFSGSGFPRLTGYYAGGFFRLPGSGWTGEPGTHPWSEASFSKRPFLRQKNI